jgi:hydrogenase-1 operon protein HyaF
MTIESVLASNATQSRPVFWLRPAGPSLSAEANLGASAQAILAEIEACALRFAETGEENSIDLRCLKSMPQERDILLTLLGRGEVSAIVEALGLTEIHETAVPCVWWVRHRNADEEIVGELIEIAEIPEVMLGDRKAVAHGLEALRIARPFRMQKVPGVTTHPNERELP